jgi:hypothetical protein
MRTRQVKCENDTKIKFLSAVLLERHCCILAVNSEACTAGLCSAVSKQTVRAAGYVRV